MSSAFRTPAPSKRRSAGASSDDSGGGGDGSGGGGASKLARRDTQLSLILGEFGLCKLVQEKYATDVLKQVLAAASAATGKKLDTVEQLVRLVSWTVAMCLAAKTGGEATGGEATGGAATGMVGIMTKSTTYLVKKLFASAAGAEVSPSAAEAGAAGAADAGAAGAADAGAAGAGAAGAAAADAGAADAPDLPRTAVDDAVDQYRQVVGTDEEVRRHGWYLAPLFAFFRNDNRILGVTLTLPDMAKRRGVLVNPKSAWVINILQSGAFQMSICTRQKIELAKQHALTVASAHAGRSAPWCSHGRQLAEDLASDAEVTNPRFFC